MEMWPEKESEYSQMMRMLLVRMISDVCAASRISYASQDSAVLLTNIQYYKQYIQWATSQLRIRIQTNPFHSNPRSTRFWLSFLAFYYGYILLDAV